LKIRRLSAAIAAVASGALLFSACSSPLGGDNGDAGPGDNGSVEADGPCKADLGEVTTADGEIKVANEQEYSGYNAYTEDTYSTYNTIISDRLMPSFWYYGTDGTICADEEFGSYEQISDEPLVAKYTINDAAVWSDGEPVNYADVLLHWATQAITADGAVTEDGTEDALFTYVGGLELGDYTPEGPQADSWDAKEMTLEFEKTHADWDLQISNLLPAHVVADQAGVSTEELVEAAR
jgi:peptide/nickel transport system substrate-binding protein